MLPFGRFLNPARAKVARHPSKPSKPTYERAHAGKGLFAGSSATGYARRFPAKQERSWDPNGPNRQSRIQRLSIARSKTGFTQWLFAHFEGLIKTEADARYVGFLKNLVSVLGSKPVRNELEGSIKSQTLVKEGQWNVAEHKSAQLLFKDLRNGFVAEGSGGVDAQLRYSYYGILANRETSKLDDGIFKNMLDLRYPIEWYPSTRTMQRTIHLHVGPTNSGKTYHALKSLEKAKSGIYAGPLRLLAYEVYTRMTAIGRACELITGDERIECTGAPSTIIKSATVEMVPVNTEVEVAVIDEIQMIGDHERGWAWTRALLGVCAPTVHLCGEARTVPLIRDLVNWMGDKLEVHTYERLSPLKTMSSSLNGDLRNLRKGDCVVAFTKVKLYALKSQIENMTDRRVAIIYGGLPPEVRAQQAALFNDSDNDYDYLVATDAVGMGLNLAIKRIIFESASKFDGVGYDEPLPVPQIKQIAGRAGRFRTSAQLKDEQQGSIDKPSIGLVTTLERQDLPIIEHAMNSEPPPIRTAGLLPPDDWLEQFSEYYPPSIPYSYILRRYVERASIDARFHHCSTKAITMISDMIQPIAGMSIRDRMMFSYAPFSNDKQMVPIAQAFARCIAENTSGHLLDIPELPLEILDETEKLNKEFVQRLEALHKALILYMWLGFRFAGCFVDRDMAAHVRGITEAKIDRILVDSSASPAIRRRILEQKRRTSISLESLDEVEDSSATNPEEPAEDPALEKPLGEQIDLPSLVEEDAESSPQEDRPVAAIG